MKEIKQKPAGGKPKTADAARVPKAVVKAAWLQAREAARAGEKQVVGGKDGAYSGAADTGEKGADGYYVKLDHGGGLQTLYAHCQTICVTAGQQVQAGQVIGYVGHTGRATGDHLHFEIVENGQRQGRPS